MIPTLPLQKGKGGRVGVGMIPTSFRASRGRRFERSEITGIPSVYHVIPAEAGIHRGL